MVQLEEMTQRIEVEQFNAKNIRLEAINAQKGEYLIKNVRLFIFLYQ